MADDVMINKAAAIERAVQRVREEHAGDDANLFENQTGQDAILLNCSGPAKAASTQRCTSYACTAWACRRKRGRLERAGRHGRRMRTLVNRGPARSSAAAL